MQNLNTQILSDQFEFTLQEFAQVTGYTDRYIRMMINDNKLPQGFEVVQLSDRKRIIKRVEKKRVEYKNPSKLTPAEILRISNCLADKNFTKPNGKPNKKLIAETCKVHYDTLNRYLSGDYRSNEQTRADKGKSRRLTEAEVQKARKFFEVLYLANVQHNVQLTIEKVEMNTGIKIPERVAYAWGRELKATNEQKHYMAKFQNSKTPHVRRDLWSEYDSFLDCVVADEWKIDEKGVFIRRKDKHYEQIEAMAYLIMFIDMKTRYPVSMVITYESISTADTLKGAMQLVRDFGRPKQWLFENQKTWNNVEFMRFILGLYDEELKNGKKNLVEFMDFDQLKLVEHSTDEVIRSEANHPQSKPIERSFRIIKDEFCAYSPSYSPNQFQSRKPELGMAHPGAHRTFEQLRYDLSKFFEYDYIDRKRVMFHNPMLSPAHKINKNRPKTIREAFEQAYLTFRPDMVDESRLSYLYGDKYKAKYTSGSISFVYKPSLEKLNFVPDEPQMLYQYEGKQLTVVINQYDIYRGWVFSPDGNLVCPAKDHRKFGSTSKERANELGKVKRKQVKLNRELIKNAERIKEIEKTKFFNYENYTKPVPVEVKTESGYLENSDLLNTHINNDLDDNDIFNVNIIDFGE